MTDNQEKEKAQLPTGKLVSLSNYIEGLWKLGGLPLVLIGLGAGNIVVPEVASYGSTEHLLVTGFMFMSGVITWGITVFLAYKRWKAELNISGQCERQLIKSFCEILSNEKSDSAAVRERVKTLTDAVNNIKTQKIYDLPFIGTSNAK